jgi:hypothetical protein
MKPTTCPICGSEPHQWRVTPDEARANMLMLIRTLGWTVEDFRSVVNEGNTAQPENPGDES